jgi:hypothetical protein
MARKRGIGQITTDLERQINADFNALIQLVVEGLSTDVSPVDTGFFASSWKASTQRIKAKDAREDFQLWARYKKGRQVAEIRPRFDIPNFNYKKQPTVYVGNAAIYATSALASKNSSIPQFIQGEMGDLVRSTFSDRKGGRIFAATGSTDPAKGVGIFADRRTVSYERVGG